MPEIPFTCPYCGRDTTITNPNFFSTWDQISLQTPVEGKVGLRSRAISCPNQECKKLSLKVFLTGMSGAYGQNEGDTIRTWQLLPESDAKVLPDYIPTAIRQDYYEACRIRDLSPKASATLSRRSLQGMIRDYWKITKGTLKEEIDALEDKLEPEVWEAIDAVRKVGNIGAHMEKDINVIINVEPNEAQLLINLTEQLITEWYVARDSRKKRLQKVKELTQKKSTGKKVTKPPKTG